MASSIKKIADMACLTTSTPRYFDEIGLLKPAGTGRMMYKTEKNLESIIDFYDKYFR